MSIGDIFFDPDDPQSVSMTKQSFKDECDINRIVRRYIISGDMSGFGQLVNRNGRYMDVSMTQDFKASSDLVAGLSSLYQSRADIREKFRTFGAFLMAFEPLSDRGKDLADLGLIKAAEGVVGSSTTPAAASATEKAASTDVPKPVDETKPKGGDSK